MRADIAADARETVFQHAAREELVGDLRHHRTPRAVLAREAVVVDRLQAVQVIRHQPKELMRDNSVLEGQPVPPMSCIAKPARYCLLRHGDFPLSFACTSAAQLVTMTSLSIGALAVVPVATTLRMNTKRWSPGATSYDLAF